MKITDYSTGFRGQTGADYLDFVDHNETMRKPWKQRAIQNDQIKISMCLHHDLIITFEKHVGSASAVGMVIVLNSHIGQ